MPGAKEHHFLVGKLGWSGWVCGSSCFCSTHASPAAPTLFLQNSSTGKEGFICILIVFFPPVVSSVLLPELLISQSVVTVGKPVL